MVKKYGWLQHTSRGEIRWEPYDYQIEMLESLQNGDNIITLKSRQIGCSWTTAAYLIWLIIFNPSINCIVLSQKELYAVKFLEKAKFFFNRLPRFLKPNVVSDSKTQFTVQFRAKRPDGDYKIANSSVDSLTTTTDTGRSFSARLVIMDEAAFLPNGEDTWKAVKPTTTHGGQIAVISTPNRINWFHTLWAKAEAGESLTFKPIIAYYRDCGFDDEWLAKVTDGMSVTDILQEYELQFLTSGNPFFDLNKLALCYYDTDELGKIVDADGKSLNVKTYINFTGVDPSEGAGDYHSIVSLNQHGVQLDAWHSKDTSLEDFSGYTMTLPDGSRVEVEGRTSKWHRMYPGYMVIEQNNSGQTVYSRHITPDDDRSITISRKTTGGTAGAGSKMRILNLLKLAVAGRQIYITDLFTYRCMQSFESKQGGQKAEAADGAYDDPVMALAHSYAELYKYGGYVIEMPERTVGGQRMVALRKEDDLSIDELASAIHVDGGVIDGPILDESPGGRRFVDERDRRLRPPRVSERIENW